MFLPLSIRSFNSAFVMFEFSLICGPKRGAYPDQILSRKNFGVGGNNLGRFVSRRGKGDIFNQTNIGIGPRPDLTSGVVCDNPKQIVFLAVVDNKMSKPDAFRCFHPDRRLELGYHRSFP